ncbi:MAG: hypothetical protein OEV43_10090, partial [Coriobacteriia bacterium]|nr:hypothetical protein [Coriobacteriia bacterium]
MKRPSGLMVVALLALVIGAAQILVALGYFGLAAFDWLAITELTGDLTEYAIEVSYAFGAALGVLGLGALVFGIGSLAMRAWAWTLGVVVYAIQIVLAVAMLLMFGIGVNSGVVGIAGAIILWYLSVPQVREAFGHEANIA